MRKRQHINLLSDLKTSLSATFCRKTPVQDFSRKSKLSNFYELMLLQLYSKFQKSSDTQFPIKLKKIPFRTILTRLGLRTSKQDSRPPPKKNKQLTHLFPMHPFSTP